MRNVRWLHAGAAVDHGRQLRRLVTALGLIMGGLALAGGPQAVAAGSGGPAAVPAPGGSSGDAAAKGGTPADRGSTSEAASSLKPTATRMNIQEIKSPGGIKAWLVEEHSVPLLALRFVFDGGSSQDPVGKEGLANFLTAMLDEGAAR